MSGIAVQPGDAAALQRIVTARFHCKLLKPDPIPEDILRAVLSMTQRAPSSFNVQPYRIVVAKSAEARAGLAAAMVGPENQRRVRSAPVSCVFCADVRSLARLPRLRRLWAEMGIPRAHVDGHVVKGLTVMSLGFGSLIQPFARLVLSLLLGFASLFKVLPQPVAPEAWAFKQLGFAADHLLLAATAHGLGAAAMEGVSSRHARRALGVPPDHVVMCVVSLGWPDMPQRWAPRFAPEEVFCEDSFDTPYQGVRPLEPPKGVARKAPAP